MSLRLQLPPALLTALVQWENDVTIRHLHHVCNSERHYESMHFSLKDVREKVFSMTQESHQFFWFIEANDMPVGFLTGEIDPPHLYHHEPYSFWPGLVIGDARARGIGLGKKAMEWCEEMAILSGCARIELGVFAHNTRARRLYESLGYEEIGRIPDFTWWQGTMHEDIRLEKWL